MSGLCQAVFGVQEVKARTESTVTMWRILLCCCLLTHSVISQYYYDYEIEDKCSESPNDPSLACQRWTSCVNCRGSEVNCQCDTICSMYDDCCPDATVSASKRIITNEQVSCQKEIINRLVVSIAVINKCPDEYNNIDGVGSACSTQQEQGYNLLVQSQESQLIYANKECCSCHGEISCDFVEDIEVLCSDSITDEAANATIDSVPVILHQLLAVGSYIDSNNITCEIQYNQPTITYRSCPPDLVYTCKKTADVDDIFRCYNESTNYVYEQTSNGGETIDPPYRNEWCAKCNNITRYHCRPPAKYSTPPSKKGLSSLVSLADVSCVQTNMDSAVQTAELCDDGEFSCPAKQSYVPLQGCRSTTGEGKQNETEEEANTMPNPDSTLTAVLLVVSLVCLLVQLSLYCMFKALRNIPGVILICLSISLFAAELIFLLSIFLESVDGVVGTAYCSAIAITMHYSYLASLFWTNVMAFDVTRMLAMPMKPLGKSRIIWYSIYAWGCPIVIVVFAIVAEVTNLKVQPRYPVVRCWISSVDGLLAYFLGPVFLILATNIVLYIVSIVSIVRAARQTKMVNPNLKERLYLALKLFVVMGIPWIVSVIAAFGESIALNYIFSIVLSLQGALLTVCYVFSKTVLNILRKRDKQRSTKSYISGRTSTYSVSSRSSNNAISSGKYGRQSSRFKEQEAILTKRFSCDTPTNVVGPQMAPKKTTVV